MRVVINKCFGGFGLSHAAYEKLIEYGVPVRAYVAQERGDDGLWKPQPLNDGEVIFDRRLSEPEIGYSGCDISAAMTRLSKTPYWDCWTRETRNHPLVVRVVEELGEAANGRCAKLKIVEIPDGVEWEIDEYGGMEHVAEKHRTWG